MIPLPVVVILGFNSCHLLAVDYVTGLCVKGFACFLSLSKNIAERSALLSPSWLW